MLSELTTIWFDGSGTVIPRGDVRLPPHEPPVHARGLLGWVQVDVSDGDVMVHFDRQRVRAAGLAAALAWIDEQGDATGVVFHVEWIGKTEMKRVLSRIGPAAADRYESLMAF